MNRKIRWTSIAGLAESLDRLLDKLVEWAPRTLSGRVSRAEKECLTHEMERGMQARVDARNLAWRNEVERKHAQEVLDLARIAARRDEESREEALGDPIVEKMIVKAKELLDADSASSMLSEITRQA